MTSTYLLVWGIVAHIVADWFFQTENIALKKTDLRNHEGWLHGAHHFIALMLVFPFWFALALTAAHIAIDTRKPLAWWRNLIGQTNDPKNPVFIPFAMAQDQAAHVVLIALAAWIAGRWFL